MIHAAFRGASLAALALLGFSPRSAAQAAPRPDDYAIQGVRVERGDDGRRATLLLKDGRIDAVLEPEAVLPHGVRVIDGAELLALPAFVDAYSRAGCPTPAPVADQDRPVDVREDVAVDMRSANRKGIQPAFRAVDVLALDAATVKAWTDQGFGALLSAPGGELLAGESTLAALREAAARDLVIHPQVHAHAAFEASGSGYPSTLMGYHAQLRQFFLDVERQAELELRHRQGRPGPRPAYDAELAAARPLLAGERLLVCAAETARDAERWLGLAREFDLRIALAGGREVWKVAERLERLDIPVVLTLDWGEEVEDPSKEAEKKGKARKGADPEQEEESGEETEEEEDKEKDKDKDKDKDKPDEDEAWTYVEPFAVRAERRRVWEEWRDSAIALHQAGVRIAFGTGSGKPQDLLDHVRALVEAGLPAEAALEGLTAGAAAAVGAEKRLGLLAPGMDATLVLWAGDPLTDKQAEPAWVFVDGFALEREREPAKKERGGGDDGPAEGVTATGTWTLALRGENAPESAVLTLSMEDDGALSGSYAVTLPDGDEETSEVEGRLSGTELTLRGTFEVEGETMAFTLTATVAGDTLEGSAEIELPWEEEPVVSPFTGTRGPLRSARKGGLR